MFEEMGRGFLAAPVTPPATEFAAGDLNKLTAVAFARMLSERGIEFAWHEDNHFTVGLYEIEPRHVTNPDAYYPTAEPASQPYVLIGHFLVPPTNLIVLLGVGASKLLADTDTPGWALSTRDWLFSFPSQWRGEPNPTYTRYLSKEAA